MADEGALPPPPPRPRPRPTILGRDTGPDNAGLARPAPPPPPGVRAPPVPRRSASLDKTDDASLFQLPPPPKVMTKPAILGSKPSSTSTKRGKIEIQVLDARPMSEVGFRANVPKMSGGDSALKSPQSPNLLIDFDSDFTSAPPSKPSPPEKPVNGRPGPAPARPTFTKTSPISPGPKSKPEVGAKVGSLIDIDLETESVPAPVRRSRSPGPARPTSQPRGRSPSPKPPRPAPPRPSSPAPKTRGPPRPRSPSPNPHGAPPRPRSPSPRPPGGRPAPPRPSSQCPVRPVSSVNAPSPDNQDTEVIDNLVNEKLIKMNEPVKPKPIGSKPTIIRAKPPDPFQQPKSPDEPLLSGQGQGQGRVIRKTTITTSTTTVRKEQKCPQPFIGGFGLIGLAAGATAAVVAAGAAPPEEKKVSKPVVTQRVSLPAGIATNENTKPQETERKSRPTVIRPTPKQRTSPVTSPGEKKPSEDLNDLAESFENKQNESRVQEVKNVNRPSSLNPAEIGQKKAVPLLAPAPKKKMPPPPRPTGGPTKPTAPKPKISVTGPPRPKLPGRPKPGHPLYHYMVKGQPHGKAKFDYTGQQHDELSFKKDDLIVLVRRMDAEWLVGKLGDSEGMFPQDFIKVIEPLPGENTGPQAATIEHPTWDDAAEEKPDNGVGPRCRARFDYEGESADDLSFEDGDIIQLVDRVGDEWLKGNVNGKTGLFPLAFVEIIEDLPATGAAGANDWPVDSADGTDDNTADVLYDFDGQDGDLSLKAGDKVHVLSQVSAEWLHGECAGKRGTFPANFIDRVPSNLPPCVPSEPAVPVAAVAQQTTQFLQPPEPSSTRDAHCIGRYDFQGEAEGDLSFQTGDRIALIGKVGDDWLRGKLNGRDGIFPTDFVEIIVDLPDDLPTPASDIHSPGSPEMPTDDDLPKATALYDFQGDQEELSFATGDMIVLLDKIDDDWMVGECHDVIGRFPTAFVEILTPLP
ncbi:SH3 domain-containing protein 19-like isoform X2 [Lineus longissimus]|uniref:SH3 domain-containing protein 19-like isoform X2 n=1 Tax=Lineus longissimus TaxID=88925 RepID=UPI00315DB841